MRIFRSSQGGFRPWGMLVFLFALLCTTPSSAQGQAGFRLERQAEVPSFDTSRGVPRLDSNLNVVRTGQEAAAFAELRRRMRQSAEAKQSVGSSPGRVRQPYRGGAVAKAENVAAVFTVNIDYDDPDDNPGDGVCFDGFANGPFDECTLRAAIEEANATAGTDPVVIRIDMRSPDRQAVSTVAYDAADDFWTLFVNTDASEDTFSVLPPITRDNVLIDATTQLDGSGVGDFPDAYCGVPVTGDTSIIKVALDGSMLTGGSEVGLDIRANNVEIRGLALKNFPGSGISAIGADSLKIDCSYLGTDHLARSAEPNGNSGLVEQGGLDFRITNSIASGNLISGVILGSAGSRADSSFFGVDVTGVAGLGNGDSGVFVTGQQATIETVVASGNDTGLWLTADSAVVTRSFVGVGLGGTTAVANETGIRIYGDNNQIGGEPPGSRMIVSGNTQTGILLSADASSNLIAGAIVGADPSGASAIPNMVGIQDSGSGNSIGEEVIPSGPAVVGSEASVTIPASGVWSNLISGNSSTGILANGSTKVVRNYIGTDSLGTSALGNGVYGINVSNGTSHQIGTGSSNGNLVSGNGNVGVYFGPLVTDASVAGNFIGTDFTGASSLANGAAGIRVDASGAVVIGGDASSQNVIAYNVGPGVQVNGTGSTDISHNRIFENQGIGIDLGGDGVTPNDGGTPPDTDPGPNGLQNYPVVTGASAGSISTWITFSFFSTPSTEFRYDIYASDAADPSGYGEGAVFVGAYSASTDGAGFFAPGVLLVPVSDAPVGSWVTVTATSPSGETSEFSNAFQVIGEVVSLDSSKVYLQGPYAAGSMSTQLLTNGDIPLSQPYSDASYNGTLQEFDVLVSVTTIPAGTVDWITLSLRSSTDPASEVRRTVAFLRSDGTITDKTGAESVDFGDVSDGSYYVVVCHRNHLCVMSASAVDFSTGTGSYDFTTGLAQGYSSGGAAMKALGDGSFGLFAADADHDGQVTASDFNAWIGASTAGLTGYQTSDYNLDGNVTAPDFNAWNANTTVGAASQVPN